MFDYDLVGTKAVYRNYLPRDFPHLLRLALRQCEERKREPAKAREAVARTVAEISRYKAKGGILMIEVEEDPVGFCILANRWSHERGEISCACSPRSRPGGRSPSRSSRGHLTEEPGQHGSAWASIARAISS